MTKAPVAVVILTKDEEANLPGALESVCGWASEVWVLDSFSADKTVEVASKYPCRVAKKEFVSFPDQRNHALRELPIEAEWVLFLDADERVSPGLREEISSLLAMSPVEDGFYMKRRFYWMGRWLRRGYYPVWLLRLCRKGASRCEARSVNEHIVVDGTTELLNEDLYHEDAKPLEVWLEKHQTYARLEAEEMLAASRRRENPSFWGAQAERKRWIRLKVWDRLPLFVRPFFYFTYRYFLTGAFVEGTPALCYHSLQALWYPILIDYHVMRLRSPWSRTAPQKTPETALR